MYYCYFCDICRRCPAPVSGLTPSTSSAPQACPPSFIPEKEKSHAMGFEQTPGTDLIAPSTVAPCINEITHVWLKNNTTIWIKPIAVDESIIACWAWNGVNWYLTQIPLTSVDCFLCKWF